MYDISNSLGVRMEENGNYKEAKALFLVALEGRRRVLGAEHKKTLDSLNNMGNVLANMEDYEGALDYYKKELRAKERVLGKKHPSTLMTTRKMVGTFKYRLKDFTKAEEMYRLALDGYEKPLGKDHAETKRCAMNMATLKSKEKARELVKGYPRLLLEGEGIRQTHRQHLHKIGTNLHTLTKKQDSLTYYSP